MTCQKKTFKSQTSLPYFFTSLKSLQTQWYNDYRHGGSECSSRMRGIGVGSPVVTDLSRKNN